MKDKITRIVFLPILGLAAISLTLSGCSKRQSDKVADKTAEVYQDTKTAVANTWQDVKDYTFEKKSDFQDRAKAVSSDLEAKISSLQAEYAGAKASASRKAAMDELKDSKADFDSKLGALGQATADTWASAKAEVIKAWDRLDAAYDKAKADAS